MVVIDGGEEGVIKGGGGCNKGGGGCNKGGGVLIRLFMPVLVLLRCMASTWDTNVNLPPALLQQLVKSFAACPRNWVIIMIQ